MFTLVLTAFARAARDLGLCAYVSVSGIVPYATHFAAYTLTPLSSRLGEPYTASVHQRPSLALAMNLSCVESHAATSRVTALCRYGSSVWIAFSDGVILSRNASTGRLEGFLAGRSEAYVPSCMLATVGGGVLVGYRNGAIRLYPAPNITSKVAAGVSQVEDHADTLLYQHITPIEVLRGFDDGAVQQIVCARNIVYYVKSASLHMLDMATRASVLLSDPFATATSRVTNIALVSSNASEPNAPADALWVFSTSAASAQTAISAAVSSSASPTHITVIPINPKTGVADVSQAKKEVIRLLPTTSVVEGQETGVHSSITLNESHALRLATLSNGHSQGAAIIYALPITGLTSPHVVLVTASGQVQLWRVPDRVFVGACNPITFSANGSQQMSGLTSQLITHATYLQPTGNWKLGLVALCTITGHLQLFGMDITSLPPSPKARSNAGSSSTAHSTSNSFSSTLKVTPVASFHFRQSLFVGSIAIPRGAESDSSAATIWVATAFGSEATHILKAGSVQSKSESSAVTTGKRCALHNLSDLRVEPAVNLLDEVMERTSATSRVGYSLAFEALQAMRTKLSLAISEKEQYERALADANEKRAQTDAELARLTSGLAEMETQLKERLESESAQAYERGVEEANAQLVPELEKVKKLNDEMVATVGTLEKQLKLKTSEIDNLQSIIDQKEQQLTKLAGEVNAAQQALEESRKEASDAKSQLEEKSSQLTRLESELKSKESEVNRLSQEIAEARDALKTSTHPTDQLQAKETELKELETRLADKDRELSTIAAELVQAQQELEASQGAVEEATRALEMKEQELKELREALSAVPLRSSQAGQTSSVEVKQLEAKIDTLTAESDDLKSKLESVTKQLHAEAQKLKAEEEKRLETENKLHAEEEQRVKTQEDYAKLQAQLQDTAEKLQAGEAKLMEAEKQCAELKAQLSDATERLQKSIEQPSGIEDTQALHNQIAELNEQLRTQQDKVTALTTEQAELKAELDDVKNQLEQERSKTKDYEELKQQLEDAKNKASRSDQTELSPADDSEQIKAELARALEELKAERDAAARLRNECAELQDRVTKAEAQAEDVVKRNTELEEQLKAKSQEALLGAMNAVKVGLLEAQVKELQEDLERSNKTIEDVRQEGEDTLYKAVRDQHREWEAKLEETLSTLMEITASYAELREEYDRLRKATESTAAAPGEVVGALEEMTREYHDFRLYAESTIQQASERAKTLEKLLQEGEAKRSDLERQLQEAESKLADLSKQPQGQEDESKYAELERQLRDIENMRADLEKQLQEGESNRANLEKQLYDGEVERAALEKQLQEGEAKCTDLERQLQESESKYAELEKQLQDIENRRADLEKQFHEGEAERAALGKQFQEGAAKCADLERQLQESEAMRTDLERQLQGSKSSAPGEVVDALEQMTREYHDYRVYAESTMQQSNARAENLEKQLQEIERTSADLKKQLQESEAIRADLERQLQEAESKHADVNKQPQGHEDEGKYAELEKQLQESEGKRADLEKQLHETESRRADLEKRLQESESKAEKATLDAERLAEEHTQAISQLDALKQKADEIQASADNRISLLEKEAATTKTRIIELQEAVTRETERAQRLLDELEDAKSRSTEMEKSLAFSQDEARTERKLREEVEAEARELREKIRIVTERSEQLERARAQALESIHSKEAEVVRQADELVSDQQTLLAELDKCTDRITFLESELQEAVKQRDEAKLRLQELESSKFDQQPAAEGISEEERNSLLQRINELETELQQAKESREELSKALDKGAEREAELSAKLQSTSESLTTAIQRAVEHIRQRATSLRLEKEVAPWLADPQIDLASQKESLAMLAQPNPRVLDGTAVVLPSGSTVENVDSSTAAQLDRVSNAIVKANELIEKEYEQHRKFVETAAARAAAKRTRLQALMEQISAVGGEGVLLQIKKSSEEKQPASSDEPKATLITTGLIPRTPTETGQTALEVIYDAVKRHAAVNDEDIKVIETDELFIPTLNSLNLELAKLAKESELLEVIQKELARLQNLELIARDAVRELYLLIRRFENMTDLVAVKRTSAFRGLSSPVLSPPLTATPALPEPSPELCSASTASASLASESLALEEGPKASLNSSTVPEHGNEQEDDDDGDMTAAELQIMAEANRALEE